MLNLFSSDNFLCLKGSAKLISSKLAIQSRGPQFKSRWGKTSSLYRDKICVYDEHPLAGRDIQYRVPDSQSRNTTPFKDTLK